MLCSKIQQVKFQHVPILRHVLFLLWLRVVEICTLAMSRCDIHGIFHRKKRCCFAEVKSYWLHLQRKRKVVETAFGSRGIVETVDQISCEIEYILIQLLFTSTWLGNFLFRAFLSHVSSQCSMSPSLSWGVLQVRSCGQQTDPAGNAKVRNRCLRIPTSRVTWRLDHVMYRAGANRLNGYAPSNFTRCLLQ